MSKPFAAAAKRKTGAILTVLKSEFASREAILEIGSGTGQHAVTFAQQLSHLRWQPSDVGQYCAGIAAWVAEAGLPNVAAPIVLDVLDAPRVSEPFDGVYSANTAHIMSADAVGEMFSLVGNLLPPGGVFALYGPFRQHGQYNTDSNAAFDRSLRQRDVGMGIRDLEWLDELAQDAGMNRTRLYAMPANNHLAVWSRREDAA